MTSQPSSIRAALDASRPWRRRLVWVVVGWVLVIAFGALLGQLPSVPQLAALFAAVAMISWYLVDHAEANTITHWPTSDLYRSRSHRGQDFRVTNLATRLSTAGFLRETREGLVDDLHGQLSTIIRERLYAKHGLVIEEEPDWSEGVMPPELWDFLMHVPDPDLWRRDRLDQIIRRIEQW